MTNMVKTAKLCTFPLMGSLAKLKKKGGGGRVYTRISLQASLTAAPSIYTHVNVWNAEVFKVTKHSYYFLRESSCVA